MGKVVTSTFLTDRTILSSDDLIFSISLSMLFLSTLTISSMFLSTALEALVSTFFTSQSIQIHNTYYEVRHGRDKGADYKEIYSMYLKQILSFLL